MKRLIFLIFLVSTFRCHSQLTQAKLISETLDQLHIPESKVFTQQPIVQNFDSESLIVIPVISKEEEGILIFDAHLVLVHNATGQIISKYLGNSDWFSDALVLKNIKIDSTRYRLNESELGYAIKIEYANGSRPAPYYSTELSLFVREGEQLKPVLKDYRISYLNGETDTRCNGDFETHSKSLEITDIKNNGFYNLKFTDSIQKSVSTDQHCEPTVVENSQAVEILQFDDGTYKNTL
ncbi:hypothetical protein FK178_06345 [Antarcticibacterium arcticum]|uniref:Uncharacterized protein n=1 Tax=Antarcticibacterium arcticum TaxID=2585771 RepID=A0A5B8YIB6_9FLAO|nr:hypothetical protein [Antarcticibacterium arcticum]QED37361.1 hypothetical protein FK178_06345 [Antarcticibacterium arcticum]